MHPPVFRLIFHLFRSNDTVKSTIYRIAGYSLLVLFGLGSLSAQTGGDILNEVPLVPVPPDMTFEEYQDMNRRLSVGLVMSAIPVPGMIHFYAGEKRTGWLILGTATLGVVTMVSGAMVLEEGNYPESDFELMVLNPGDEERERRFEKIPVEMTGSDTTFRLNEIFRKPGGTGLTMMLLGGAIIVADIAYDFVHGIKVIEEKRDRVRYKYGQTLSLSMTPEIDFRRQTATLHLALRF